MKYRGIYFSFLIIAAISIPLHVWLLTDGKKHYFEEFLVGAYPYVVAISPLVGLLLGLLDVRLSSIVLRRIDEAVLELDAPQILEAQSPYISKGIVGLGLNALYVLGEESIRGVILFYSKYLFKLSTLSLLLTGTFLFFFVRALPWYLRLVKLIDDFVLTVLFLMGGVLSAWIAHAVMNAYILWPLVKHEQINV